MVIDTKKRWEHGPSFEERDATPLAALYAAGYLGMVGVNGSECRILLALCDDGGNVQRSIEAKFEMLGIG